MKNGMIRIGMFEAYLERMLIRGLKVAYISLAAKGFVFWEQ